MSTWSMYPNQPLPQGSTSSWSRITYQLGTETRVLSSHHHTRLWLVCRVVVWCALMLLSLTAAVLGWMLGGWPGLVPGFALGTLTGYCGRAAWRSEPLVCGAEHEALVAAVVGAEVRVDRTEGRSRLGKYKPMERHAQYWALKVRERFGVVANKAADLAAVRRWIADEMTKDEHHAWKDMRIQDRVVLQTLVTRLSVLPTVMEIEVEHMVRGAFATDLLAQYKAAQK